MKKTIGETTVLSQLTAILLGLFLYSTAAWSANNPDIGRVFVFGDSLSDTGNALVASAGAVPFPMYYNKGRWSNGPVWVDYLAKDLIEAAGASDFAMPSSLGFISENGISCPAAGASCSYAFGGSGTQDGQTPTGIVPGLSSQIEMFESELAASEEADSSALYIIWSGANNYLFPAFNEIFGSLFGPLLPSSKPADVVGDISDAVEKLTALGARKFLVVNLPDLGSVPLAAPFLGPIVEPKVRSELTKQTLKYNRRLARTVSKLNRSGRDTGREVLLLDAYTLFKLELSNPGSASAGPASACLLPTFFPNAPCDPEFPPDFDAELATKIWDEQHPTTDLHAKVAKRALKVLADFN